VWVEVSHRDAERDGIELHRSERKLAQNLSAIAARHRADTNIHYAALDLARWSESHLHQLVEHGQRQGLNVSPHRRSHALAAVLQGRVADVLPRRPEPALVLLADLRRVYRHAAGVSVDWELLGQAAQSAKDDDLLQLTSRCRPLTLRQMRWANAMLKELSPQGLTS
jgi:hypothetical protein